MIKVSLFNSGVDTVIKNAIHNLDYILLNSSLNKNQTRRIAETVGALRAIYEMVIFTEVCDEPTIEEE